MCFCQVDSPAGSDAISNGKAPITGNAGALARNEREARNDYLAEVLSRSEKILCAYEAVRARAPAFPVIRSDYRNCISTSGPVLIRSTTSRPTQIGCRIVEAIRRAHFAAEDADDSSALVTPYLAEEHETAGAYVLSPVTLFRGISGGTPPFQFYAKRSRSYCSGSCGTSRLTRGRCSTYLTRSPWLPKVVGKSNIPHPSLMHSSTLLGGPQRR